MEQLHVYGRTDRRTGPRLSTVATGKVVYRQNYKIAKTGRKRVKMSIKLIDELIFFFKLTLYLMVITF